MSKKIYRIIIIGIISTTMLTACGENSKDTENTQIETNVMESNNKEKYVNGWNISENNYLANGNLDKALELMDTELIIYTELKESILEEVLDYPQSYYGELVGFKAKIEDVAEFKYNGIEELNMYTINYKDKPMKIISNNTKLELKEEVNITGWLIGQEEDSLIIVAGYCQKMRDEVNIESVENQDYMKYADQTKEEVLGLLGEPSSKEIYDNGEWWIYEKKSVIFADEGKGNVAGIYLGLGEKIAGVTVGLGLEDIQKVLGKEDIVLNENSGLYTLSYRINNNLIVFSSETEKDKTISCEIFFKSKENTEKILENTEEGISENNEENKEN